MAYPTAPSGAFTLTRPAVGGDAAETVWFFCQNVKDDFQMNTTYRSYSQPSSKMPTKLDAKGVNRGKFTDKIIAVGFLTDYDGNKASALLDMWKEFAKKASRNKGELTADFNDGRTSVKCFLNHMTSDHDVGLSYMAFVIELLIGVKIGS